MDLNGDGNLDILSGSYSREDEAMAGLFQVLWGESKGKFGAPKVLNGNDDKPLIVGNPELAEDEDFDMESATPEEQEAYFSAMTDAICTRPTAADINGDGHLDLVVGNASGSFYLHLGEGKGKFAAAGNRILAGKKALQVMGTSDPCVVDWDQDGDLDIVSGSRGGGVFLALNEGTKSSYDFKPFTQLIAPAKRSSKQKFGDSHIVGPGQSTRVWVEDLNDDGKLDILLGDTVDLMFPAHGLEEEEVAPKLAKWQKKMNKLRNENDPKEREIFEKMEEVEESEDLDEDEKEEKLEELEKELEESFKAMEPLYKEREEIVREVSTGYVWVYLQKSDQNSGTKKAAKKGRSTEEFKEYVAEKMQDLDDEQLDAIADAVDKDGNGIVSEAEFEDRMSGVRSVLSDDG